METSLYPFSNPTFLHILSDYCYILFAYLFNNRLGTPMCILPTVITTTTTTTNATVAAAAAAAATTTTATAAPGHELCIWQLRYHLLLMACFQRKAAKLHTLAYVCLSTRAMQERLIGFS